MKPSSRKLWIWITTKLTTASNAVTEMLLVAVPPKIAKPLPSCPQIEIANEVLDVFQGQHPDQVDCQDEEEERHEKRQAYRLV